MFMCVCELFVLYVSTLHCKIFNTGFYFLPSCRCFLSRAQGRRAGKKMCNCIFVGVTGKKISLLHF